MLFTSLAFLAFLPLVWGVFVALNARWRAGWLLAASLVFYGAARPTNLLYLAAVGAVAIAAAALLQRASGSRVRGWILAGGLLLVLGALVALKYHDVAVAAVEAALGRESAWPRLGLAAPAGFSFIAFSAASLLIDAWRQPLTATPAATALYLAWFPKLLAGPIERAPAFFAQLAGGLRAEPALVVLGLQWILWGLCKKVLLADNLAPLVDKAFAIPAYATPVDLLVAVYAFAFQIYGDFSGYTDIAIGVSLLFGVRLGENFRRPYLARSTAEFWSSRWHVTLGHWFRDYLYLPLGGSQAGAWRRYRNVMLVFVVSGLWHAGLGYGVGWTFVAWGALNGAYQWAGLATRPLWQRAAAALPRVADSASWLGLRRLLTFHLIALAWVFFRARSLDDAAIVLRRLAEQAAELPSLLLRYPYTDEHRLAALLVLALLAIELLDERRSLFERLAAAPRLLRWAVWYALIAALLLFGRWGLSEFIYMQF